jgi:hypothetical protein
MLPILPPQSFRALPRNLLIPLALRVPELHGAGWASVPERTGSAPVQMVVGHKSGTRESLQPVH